MLDFEWVVTFSFLSQNKPILLFWLAVFLCITGAFLFVAHRALRKERAADDDCANALHHDSMPATDDSD